MNSVKIQESVEFLYTDNELTVTFFKEIKQVCGLRGRELSSKLKALNSNPSLYNFIYNSMKKSKILRNKFNQRSERFMYQKL
jgi:hypothetical protein